MVLKMSRNFTLGPLHCGGGDGLCSRIGRPLKKMASGDLPGLPALRTLTIPWLALEGERHIKRRLDVLLCSDREERGGRLASRRCKYLMTIGMSRDDLRSFSPNAGTKRAAAKVETHDTFSIVGETHHRVMQQGFFLM